MPARVPSVPRVTPEGRSPVSLKVIGVSPVAVDGERAGRALGERDRVVEVNTGAVAVTVKVKAWVEVFELASVAVMVIG